MRRATLVSLILVSVALTVSGLELARKLEKHRDQAHLVPGIHDFTVNGGQFQDKHFNSSAQREVVFSNDKHLNPYATATYKKGLILWHGSRFQFENGGLVPALRGNPAWNRFRYNPTWFSGLASTSLAHGYMTAGAQKFFFLYKLKTNRDLKIALIPHEWYNYSRTLDQISDEFLIRRTVALMLEPIEKLHRERIRGCMAESCEIMYYRARDADSRELWSNLLGRIKQAGISTRTYTDALSLIEIRRDIDQDIQPLYHQPAAKLGTLSSSRKALWKSIATYLKDCLDKYEAAVTRNPYRIPNLEPQQCNFDTTTWERYVKNYRIMGDLSDVATILLKQSVFCDHVQGWRAPWDQNEFVLCPNALDSRWYQFGYPLEVTNRWNCSTVRMCERMRPNTPEQWRSTNCNLSAVRKAYSQPRVVGGSIDYPTVVPPFNTSQEAMDIRFDDYHPDFESVCQPAIPENATAPAPLLVF